MQLSSTDLADDDFRPPQPTGRTPAAQPGGLLAQLMGGGAGAMAGAYGGYGGYGGFGGYGAAMPAHPSAYDEYFKAY